MQPTIDAKPKCRMIDQRKLTAQEVYVRCKTARKSRGQQEDGDPAVPGIGLPPLGDRDRMRRAPRRDAKSPRNSEKL